jgi:CDP-glucose 4,6-dehydratase
MSIINDKFWFGKKVVITGHTGFKGAWLTIWLNSLNAKVFGISLEPENDECLFNLSNIKEKIQHNIVDIRDYKKLSFLINEIQPDFIFHLAAQPLVRKSYIESRYTWETNVLGSINLLESMKYINIPCTTIFVTTDKVYHNTEKDISYNEDDILGGFDPYSSSKSAVELAVNSWRNSFFTNDNKIRIATVRAGNVIGGGDWSEDRIIPDAIKNLINKNNIIVRNPNYVRPWQHVLDPLSGYLNLAEKISSNSNKIYQSAFNFGPDIENKYTVLDLVNEIFKYWQGQYEIITNPNELHESELLSLSILKSKKYLNWRPNWSFEESIYYTIDWYKNNLNGMNALENTLKQIQIFNKND